ncbi:hypothetical protein [Caballeronia pedi]|uniref:hypothetical protein n=1 Tax=Caballeronia pedi TaxID=1777141 RepID=UPI001178CAB9|nr:hypothetical protein [Caballeronia pedi]
MFSLVAPAILAAATSLVNHRFLLAQRDLIEHAYQVTVACVNSLEQALKDKLDELSSTLDALDREGTG